VWRGAIKSAQFFEDRIRNFVANRIIQSDFDFYDFAAISMKINLPSLRDVGRETGSTFSALHKESTELAAGTS
jgi:hypothetical protein